MVIFEADHGGANDVYLVNKSELDAKLPSQVSISAQGCEFADAMPPYDLEQQTKMVRFSSTSDHLLRAGEKQLIGWIRCSSKALVAHVSF